MLCGIRLQPSLTSSPYFFQLHSQVCFKCVTYSSPTMQPLFQLIQKDSTQVQGWVCTEAQSSWRSLQRTCLSPDCANVKKLQEELLAYCHLTTTLFVPRAFPSSERGGKQQKTAIRLKQSPCVLINIHLHDNSPLWLNSSRWVQHPVWCYGLSEKIPQCPALHCVPQPEDRPRSTALRLLGLSCTSKMCHFSQGSIQTQTFKVHHLLE